jgi:hypothetical protein
MVCAYGFQDFLEPVGLRHWDLMAVLYNLLVCLELMLSCLRSKYLSRGVAGAEDVVGWVDFGEGKMSGDQYQTSKLVVLQQPQRSKEVSLWLLVFLLHQIVLLQGSRRDIEGAQTIFGDGVLIIAGFSKPLRFLFQTLPSQILLLPKHVRLLRPWYRSSELRSTQLEHDRAPTPTVSSS